MQPRRPSVVSIGATSKATNTIPKSGPRRRQLSTIMKAPDPAVLPGVPKVGKFISLSQQNRMYKRGRNEPAPDINALELFHAGEPKSSSALIRRVSGPVGLTQPLEPKGLPGDMQRNKELAQFENSGLGVQDVEELRGPKRRKTDEGPKVQILSLGGYQATLAKRRDSAQKAPELITESNRPDFEDQMGFGVDGNDMRIGAHEDTPPLSGAPTANNDLWGPKKPPTGPAGWQANKMDLDELEPSGILEPPVKPTFVCELDMGPTSNTEAMGAVTFTGFSSNFTSFVEGLNINRLWVSRFLEDAYISNFLVPVSRRNGGF